MNTTLLKVAQRTHELRVRRLAKIKSQLNAMKLAFSNDKLVQKNLVDVERFLDTVHEDWNVDVQKLSTGELISSAWFGNNY